MLDFTSFENATFNVGGGIDVSVSLFELTQICQKVTGNIIPIESIPETRIADVPIYITDNSRITSQCNWKSQKSAEDIVQDIFAWLTENEKCSNIFSPDNEFSHCKRFFRTHRR